MGRTVTLTDRQIDVIFACLDYCMCDVHGLNAEWMINNDEVEVNDVVQRRFGELEIASMKPLFNPRNHRDPFRDGTEFADD